MANGMDMEHRVFIDSCAVNGFALLNVRPAGARRHRLRPRGTPNPPITRRPAARDTVSGLPGAISRAVASTLTNVQTGASAS